MQIRNTKDYSIFKFIQGNRPIDRFHLKRLKKSIESNNKMSIHPIIVNEKYEIIDGQHRLEAAKQLGIDIYYIIASDIDDSHVIDCNVNQKQWEVDNYINFFSIREKSEDYIKLEKMFLKTRLKPKALMGLLLGSVNRDVLILLKTGKFKFPKDLDMDMYIDPYLVFIDYINDKRISPKSMFSTSNFTKAFRWLIMTNGFIMTLFLRKLDAKWFDLKPQTNPREWYKILIDIYNHHAREKLRPFDALET